MRSEHVFSLILDKVYPSLCVLVLDEVHPGLFVLALDKVHPSIFVLVLDEVHPGLFVLALGLHSQFSSFLLLASTPLGHLAC